MPDNLTQENPNIEEYLSSSDVIDYNNILIKERTFALAAGIEDEVLLAKNIYEYVRDSIAHSLDINGEIVTCKASDVLQHKQGVCYGKSHLLAAMLRCVGIPTGFCYQKLILDDKEKPWLIIHALNAIYLKSLKKWIRVDARGNKIGVTAEFSVDEEKLAFPIRKELGEEDGLIIYAKPNEKVLNALRISKSVRELENNLPAEI